MGISRWPLFHQVNPNGLVAAFASFENTLRIELIDLGLGIAEFLQQVGVVLAEQRGASPDFARVHGAARLDIEALDMAVLGIFPFSPDFAGDVVRVVLGNLEGGDGAAWHAVFHEQSVHIDSRMRKAEIGYSFFQLDTSGGAGQREGHSGREERVFSLLDAQECEAFLQRAGADQADEDVVAVLAFVGVVAGKLGIGVTHTGQDFLVHEPGHGVVQGDLGHHFELGQVDALTLASLLGADVGHQASPAAEESGHVVAGVGDGARGGHRFGEAVQEHIAAEGLADGIVGSAVDVFGDAFLSKTADMHDDQFGVDRPENLISEAPLRVGAALGGFAPDVGPGDEFLEDLEAFGSCGVHRDGELVAVLLVPGVLDRAAGVGRQGAFCVDDGGAVFSEQGGREGRRDNATGAEDFQSLQVTKYRYIFRSCHYSSS